MTQTELEKQILETIERVRGFKMNYPSELITKEQASKEIASLKIEGFYKKEFVEWLSFGSHPFVPFCDMMDGKLEQWYTDEISIHFSLDALYEYWQTNVKDK